VSKGHKGILNVEIDNNTKPEDIAWLILSACGITKAMIGEVAPLMYFEEICFKSIKSGTLPLVAFDITTHTTVETFKAATKIAKRLTCDARCSAALLNVSSALTTLSMNPDPRCKYIDIGPFNNDQANLFLTKAEEHGKRKLDDDQRKMVFEKLGTYPYQLLDLLNSSLDPDEYVEAELKQCQSSVQQSIRSLPKSTELYIELLKKPFLEGIEEREALAILDTVLDKAVIRNLPVLNYHRKAPGHFTFHTRAMETAAKQELARIKEKVTREDMPRKGEMPREEELARNEEMPREEELVRNEDMPREEEPARNGYCVLL